jgi:hypothetical protein
MGFVGPWGSGFTKWQEEAEDTLLQPKNQTTRGNKVIGGTGSWLVVGGGAVGAFAPVTPSCKSPLPFGSGKGQRFTLCNKGSVGARLGTIGCS